MSDEQPEVVATLLAGTLLLRRIALVLVVVLAVVASVATLTLAIQKGHADHALAQSRTALAQSNVALTRENTVLATATLAAGQAATNTQLLAALAAARNSSILRACQDQNERHDATVGVINKLLGRATAHATRRTRRQVNATRVAEVLLIDALAPKRDCAQVVRASRTR